MNSVTDDNNDNFNKIITLASNGLLFSDAENCLRQILIIFGVDPDKLWHDFVYDEGILV